MNELCNRYAVALLEIAKEQKTLEKLREEVSSFSNALKENEEFLKILSSQIISKEEKLQVIDNVMKDYSETLIDFVKVIFQHGRSNYLLKIFKETWFKFDEALNIERGVVYSSIPLADNQLSKISEVINKRTGKRCELRNLIDKSLIGGIKVVLKNDIYDASIKTQIEDLRDTLLKEGN